MAFGTALSTLTVELRTNTAKFVQGMDTARGKVGDFSKSIGTAKNAVIALAGAGGLGLLIKSSLDTVDALAKTADKLGLTTEALSKLRYAAEITGVKTQTFDMALQRMTRRLAEAAQGTGEAKAALQELGLDATRLANISPDQAFLEIASAMKQVTNQSDKVRLAFKLFDSEGVALVNTLALGAEGLNAAGREAEFFGKAISRVDAKQIETANNSISRAKAAWTGLAEILTVKIAPIIDRIAKGSAIMAANIARFFGVKPEDEKLNDLFVERLELTKQLASFMTEMSPQERADAKARLEEITAEMNAIIQRRDVTLQAYQQQRDAARAAVEEARANQTDEFDSHLEAYRRWQEEQTKVAEREAQKRAQVEQQTLNHITDMRFAAFQHAANFIRAIAPESKKAAIAALVIEKGLAIAKVKIDTLVASMNARKYGDPVTSEANARRIEALGAISIGLIAATGLAQAASINSGSGGAGTVPTVATQTPSEQAFSPFNTPTSQGSLNFYINGVMTPEIVHDLVIPAIKDAVDNYDVVIVSNDSRNGQDLLR